MPSIPPYSSPIEENPDKFNGTPVIRGTRIPIYQLIEYVDEGYSFEEIEELLGVDSDLAELAYEQRGLEDLAAGKKVPA